MPTALIGFEYERKISNKYTIALDSGGMIFNISGYGLGVNYYFNEDSLDGAYTGLYWTRLHQSALRDNNPITNFFDTLFSPGFDANIVSGTLGYKKVLNSGFAYGFSLVYGVNPEFSGKGGLFLTSTIGYGW